MDEREIIIMNYFLIVKSLRTTKREYEKRNNFLVEEMRLFKAFRK